MGGSLILEVTVMVVIVAVFGGALLQVTSEAVILANNSHTLSQAIMAAREKIENYRSSTVVPVGTFSWQPDGLEALGPSTATITSLGPRLFRVSLQIKNKAGSQVYATETVVRVP